MSHPIVQTRKRGSRRPKKQMSCTFLKSFSRAVRSSTFILLSCKSGMRFLRWLLVAGQCTLLYGTQHIYF
eukprot:XP_001708687.1 Hypothetical protein GL50803_34805 [Giardia lamblia ATCC 50803]